jgi:hypothetical protein
MTSKEFEALKIDKNKLYTICTHEAGHWTIGKLFNFDVREMNLIIDETNIQGQVLRKPTEFDRFDKDVNKGSYWRLLNSFQRIPFFASGSIAEFLHNGFIDDGSKVVGSDLSFLKGFKDNEKISRKTYRTLLQSVADYLTIPEMFGYIIRIADDLFIRSQEDKPVFICCSVNPFDLETIIPRKPQYKADDIIDWLLMTIFDMR